MDTPTSEVLLLNGVTRKEFEKLQRKLQKYKEENRTIKEFIKILARKDGLWCDDCEKVLEDHQIMRCDGPRCFKGCVCMEGHIQTYDSFEGGVYFCSKECLKNYEQLRKR